MRYVHVCTRHGASMPALEKAGAAEQFERAAAAQLAKGRKKPVVTNVARYVGRKAPSVARALRKVLQRQAKRIAGLVVPLYATTLAKDDTSHAARILRIIEAINAGEVGVDLEGELEGAMLAAFRRAAAIGATQVGFSINDITNQVDDAAAAYAGERGGELIKDLAGTTEDSMRALLERAVEEGMSTDDLAEAIEALGAFGESRAEMIARTELAFAHVQGNVEGWRASGEVVGKQWILADTHPDPDECDDAADAGVVGLDDDFVDGIDLPPAHPNCLCDVLPVLREDDSTDEGEAP